MGSACEGISSAYCIQIRNMAIVLNGKIALSTFIFGSSLLLVQVICSVNVSFANSIYDYWKYIIGFYIAIVNGVILGVYHGEAYKVAVRSCNLGVAFALGVSLAMSTLSMRLFGWYIAALAFFHWSEYFTTALTNPRNLGLESFLLDHSPAYHAAAVASVVEFFIEFLIWPETKDPGWISCIGLCLVFSGEGLRKIAMYTASTNFNHYVRHVREDGHTLVTHGVYGYSRHPSYVGWFYWSVGTQVMICNPICIVAYIWASWSFFKQRIYEEEITLLNFFGEDYLDYQKRVGTGLPFISGYRVEL